MNIGDTRASTSSWWSRARALVSARCVANVPPVLSPRAAHDLRVVEVELAPVEPLEVPGAPSHADDLPQRLGEGLGGGTRAEELLDLGDQLLVEQQRRLLDRHRSTSPGSLGRSLWQIVYLWTRN